MRFLWIEDFNGGEIGQTENKSCWEAYFELKGKTINDYRTLESVLEFLDNHSNWRRFDAVLIDIRFKVLSKEQDEMNIYKQYFSSYLTEEKFKDYAKKINDNPNNATSGVLLYLALIYRYHYNQDRIAFISANIDESSGKLTYFRNMREIIAKIRFQKMRLEDLEDSEDIDKFETQNERAYRQYGNVLNDFPKTKDIKWECLDELKKLEAKIMDVEKELAERFSNGDKLKYNSVKEEFEKIGLKVPIAFEKPNGSELEKISWLFKEWQEKTLAEDKDNYYKLRSNILDICLSIQELLEKSEPSSIIRLDIFLKKSMANETESLTDEIKQLFLDIMLLFPENSWVDENILLYSNVIKTCVAIFEKVERPTECKEQILKLTRNWMSHQGLKDITKYDVFFIFHIMINVVIKIECNKDLQNKDKNMIKEFSKDFKERSVDEIKDIINKKEKKYRQMHKEGHQEFLTNHPENNKPKGYKYDEKASFHNMLSGIGHEYSPKRNQVSMQMLYVFYLSELNITEDIKEDFFAQSVLNEVCQD